MDRDARDPGGDCRRFDDHRVMITGAGHGIGRACARRLAGEGARVAVADLDAAAAEETAAMLARPGPHRAYALDITDRAAVDRTVDTVAADLDGLDVLVNVAGGDTNRADVPSDDEDWLAMLDLNLVGHVRCCRAAEPYLIASSRHPAIVTVSSINALAAFGSLPYSSAKAGLEPLTKNLAVRLAPQGVRVNVVAPGTVRTRVWDDQPGGADRLTALYPLGRVGLPEDIAAAVAFLASADADWITGQTLPVEGGVLSGPLLPFLQLSDPESTSP